MAIEYDASFFRLLRKRARTNPTTNLPSFGTVIERWVERVLPTRLIAKTLEKGYDNRREFIDDHRDRIEQYLTPLRRRTGLELSDNGSDLRFNGSGGWLKTELLIPSHIVGEAVQYKLSRNELGRVTKEMLALGLRNHTSVARPTYDIAPGLRPAARTGKPESFDTAGIPNPRTYNNPGRGLQSRWLFYDHLLTIGLVWRDDFLEASDQAVESFREAAPDKDYPDVGYLEETTRAWLEQLDRYGLAVELEPGSDNDGGTFRGEHYRAMPRALLEGLSVLDAHVRGALSPGMTRSIARTINRVFSRRTITSVLNFPIAARAGELQLPGDRASRTKKQTGATDGGDGDFDPMSSVIQNLEEVARGLHDPDAPSANDPRTDEDGSGEPTNNGFIPDPDELIKRIIGGDYPERVKKQAQRERQEEGSRMLSVLNTLHQLPWYKHQTDLPDHDGDEARTILDEGHYGLNDVKDRVVEQLIAWRHAPDVDSPNICLLGPPGVGKSSIARNIARLLNRPFEMISLAGISSEGGLQGDHRTFSGATEGQISRAINRAGSFSPVMLLDELDKLGGYKHRPDAVLNALLDPDQNDEFYERFLRVTLDLSDVFFVVTANALSVPASIENRLEIIRVSGYSTDEKITIAQEYLLPELREQYNVDDLALDDDQIARIIKRHTRGEEGVRKLRSRLEDLIRKHIAGFTGEDPIQALTQGQGTDIGF